MHLSKLQKSSGIVLAALILIVTAMSSMFFLFELKLSLIQWVAFNSCSVINIISLICFCLFVFGNKPSALAFTILPAFYLGTLSMFVLPWNQDMLMAHAGHIFMSLHIIWVIGVLIKNQLYKAMGIGLLVGILVFSPFIAWEQQYQQLHLSEFTEIVNLNLQKAE